MKFTKKTDTSGLPRSLTQLSSFPLQLFFIGRVGQERGNPWDALVSKETHSISEFPVLPEKLQFIYFSLISSTIPRIL